MCVCVCARDAVALPTVGNLQLFDITHNTMRVRWKAAEGASGYMILYAPLTEEGSTDEKEVSARVCVCVFFSFNNLLTIDVTETLNEAFSNTLQVITSSPLRLLT